MTIADVRELLELKEWTRMDLAYNLEMTEGGVHRWFREEYIPRGPANVLMKMWLNQARLERDGAAAAAAS